MPAASNGRDDVSVSDGLTVKADIGQEDPIVASGIRLRPLGFGALRELLPAWSPEARVAAYAVCGDIPAYLNLFERAGKFDRGLLDFGLAPTGILLTDAGRGRSASCALR